MSSDTPFDPDKNPDLTKLTLIPEIAETPSGQPPKRHAIAPKPTIKPRIPAEKKPYDPDGVVNRHPFGGGILR